MLAVVNLVLIGEINARMILYNFCELVTSHAVVKTSKNTKHVYKIKVATAVNICRAYLKHGGDENRDHASHTKVSDTCQVQSKISYPPQSKEK